MSGQKGKRGMGSHKHGVSGHAGKSPKMRMAMKLEAERAQRKPRPKGKMVETFGELFRKK